MRGGESEKCAAASRCGHAAALLQWPASVCRLDPALVRGACHGSGGRSDLGSIIERGYDSPSHPSLLRVHRVAQSPCVAPGGSPRRHNTGVHPGGPSHAASATDAALFFPPQTSPFVPPPLLDRGLCAARLVRLAAGRPASARVPKGCAFHPPVMERILRISPALALATIRENFGSLPLVRSPAQTRAAHVADHVEAGHIHESCNCSGAPCAATEYTTSSPFEVGMVGTQDPEDCAIHHALASVGGARLLVAEFSSALDGAVEAVADPLAPSAAAPGGLRPLAREGACWTLPRAWTVAQVLSRLLDSCSCASEEIAVGLCQVAAKHYRAAGVGEGSVTHDVNSLLRILVVRLLMGIFRSTLAGVCDPADAESEGLASSTSGALLVSVLGRERVRAASQPRGREQRRGGSTCTTCPPAPGEVCMAVMKTVAACKQMVQALFEVDQPVQGRRSDRGHRYSASAAHHHDEGTSEPTDDGCSSDCRHPGAAYVRGRLVDGAASESMPPTVSRAAWTPINMLVKAAARPVLAAVPDAALRMLESLHDARDACPHVDPEGIFFGRCLSALMVLGTVDPPALRLPPDAQINVPATLVCAVISRFSVNDEEALSWGGNLIEGLFRVLTIAAVDVDAVTMSSFVTSLLMAQAQLEVEKGGRLNQLKAGQASALLLHLAASEAVAAAESGTPPLPGKCVPSSSSFGAHEGSSAWVSPTSPRHPSKLQPLLRSHRRLLARMAELPALHETAAALMVLAGSPSRHPPLAELVSWTLPGPMDRMFPLVAPGCTAGCGRGHREGDLIGAPRTCGGCRVAHFCSDGCASTAWRQGGHKKLCTVWAAGRLAGVLGAPLRVPRIAVAPAGDTGAHPEGGKGGAIAATAAAAYSWSWLRPLVAKAAAAGLDATDLVVVVERGLGVACVLPTAVYRVTPNSVSVVPVASKNRIRVLAVEAVAKMRVMAV